MYIRAEIIALLERWVKTGHRVGPQNKRSAVHRGAPPAGSAVGGHGAQEAVHLAAVEDGLLALVDAALVAEGEGELPVGAVEAFAAGEALDLGEVGDGVEGDEVVEDEVSAGDGARGVRFVVRDGELVPLLQEPLHFVEV